MRLPLILAALALSGCGSVVATTVAMLDQLSPLTADPADFAVRIALPDGIDVLPGSAQMTFSGKQNRTTDPISGTFVLARAGDVFRFAENDLAQIRALQAQFAVWEEEDPVAASGSIGVTMEPCIRDAGPDVGDRVSISVQIAEGGVFLPLVRNARLSSATDQETLDQFEPCPEPFTKN